MYSYIKPITLSTFFILIFVCTLKSSAQSNIKVISDEATIYTEPNTDTSLNISAKKGDIFEVINAHDEWAQIHLFSGGRRYIKSSQVENIHYIPSYPSDPSKRSKVCDKVRKARNKASRDALSKYSDNASKQSSHEQFLFDKYMLKTFRAVDIPASHYSKLVECLDDGLLPPPIKINE